MIKVYVLDDEKLVRAGIIGLIDWEKYDMEVVGDSGSSAETLEYLRGQEVDLLFSDLEMPGLSGIPFLQEVKRLRPGLQIVVLTMHQEFDLIQQALRLGILDYLTKAQIEEENVDAFMEGIRKRYLENVHYSRLEGRTVQDEECCIWIAEEQEGREEPAAFLARNGFHYETLGENHFLFSEEESGKKFRLRSLIEDYDGGASTLLELKQVKGAAFSRLEDALKTAGKGILFADRRPGCFSYTYTLSELLEKRPGISRREILRLCEKMEFLADKERYEKGMELIDSLDDVWAVFITDDGELHYSEGMEQWMKEE